MSEPLNDYKVVTYHPKTGRRIHVKVRATYYRIEEGSLVLHVDYNGAGSPQEFAMIAIKAKDDAGGMMIKKVPTHEVRLLQQEIPLV